MPKCSWCPKTATRTEGTTFACAEHARMLKPALRTARENGFVERASYRPYRESLYRKREKEEDA